MKDYSETASAATLSQSELFQRYLDARVRVNATNSTLIDDPGEMFDTTARDWFLQYAFGESFPSDYAAELLEQIEVYEYPLFELERITSDLSDLLEALNALKKDFDLLADATRTKQPKETDDQKADAAAYSEWEENPRYVLPVIEQKEAA